MKKTLFLFSVFIFNFFYIFFFGTAYSYGVAWSKAQTIDDFIAISKRGKDRGDFIMHRECGTLVELSCDNDRAVGKMKATITQRFKVQPGQANVFCGEGAEFDVDCDCRFIFFCLRDPAAGGAWKTKYVKLFYEKDKVVPVDGHRAPVFAPDVLAAFPEGYRNLGAAQSALGYPVTRHLPTARDFASWHAMYDKMEQWLGGADVDLFCADDDLEAQGRKSASEAAGLGNRSALHGAASLHGPATDSPQARGLETTQQDAARHVEGVPGVAKSQQAL